jgi:hypothetical protein
MEEQMTQAKTKPTDASVAKYIDAVSDEQRRGDAQAIVSLMKRVTRQEPKMWGASIVGFGSYHYEYASGHEGDAPLVAFSARKSEFSLYGMAGSEGQEPLLARLGRHKTGKGCLYVKRLADIDLKVLEKLIAQSFAEKKRRYPTAE